MLTYAVFFTGKNSRAGVAVKAWKRRSRGGAIQKKHSLALVRGPVKGQFRDVMEMNYEKVATSKALMLGLLTSI